MGFLPISNATLLKIASGGVIEDYDQVAGADTLIKFQGSEDALVEERVLTSTGTGLGQSNKVKDTRIIISAELSPSFDLEADDDVTYQYQDTVFTRKVMEFSTADVEGLPIPTVTIHFRTAGSVAGAT